MMELPAGHVIDGYELVRKLGSGGAGTVYLARQLSLGRDVALKLLRRELSNDPEMRERFLMEGRLAARLRHPNLVQVLGIGEEGGWLYLALDLVTGTTLRQELTRRRLGVDETVEIGIVCADVLASLHEAGVIHRDVKPENIFLDSRRGVLVGDLGIARHAGRPGGLTAAGTLLGTPAYMAPEVISGKPAGPAADVYGLAVVLYECLAGVPPFIAKEPVEILRMHLRETVPRLISARPEIGAPLEGVILAALEKEPGRRTSSATTLAAELRRALETVPTPVPDRRTQQVRMPGSRPGASTASPGAAGTRETAVAGPTRLASPRSGAVEGRGRPTGTQTVSTRAPIVATVPPSSSSGLGWGRGRSRVTWTFAAIGLALVLPATWIALRGPPSADVELPAEARRTENVGSEQPGAPPDPGLRPKAPSKDAADELVGRLLRVDGECRDLLLDGAGRPREGSLDSLLQRAAGILFMVVREAGAFARAHSGLTTPPPPGEEDPLGDVVFATFLVLDSARLSVDNHVSRRDEGADDWIDSGPAKGMVRDRFTVAIGEEARKLLEGLRGRPPDAGSLEWQIGVTGLECLRRWNFTWKETLALQTEVKERAQVQARRILESGSPWHRCLRLIEAVRSGLDRASLFIEAQDVYDRTVLALESIRPPAWLPNRMGPAGLEGFLDYLTRRWGAARSSQTLTGVAESLEGWRNLHRVLVDVVEVQGKDQRVFVSQDLVDRQARMVERGRELIPVAEETIRRIEAELEVLGKARARNAQE